MCSQYYGCEESDMGIVPRIHVFEDWKSRNDWVGGAGKVARSRDDGRTGWLVRRKLTPVQARRLSRRLDVMGACSYMVRHTRSDEGKEG